MTIEEAQKQFVLACSVAPSPMSKSVMEAHRDAMLAVLDEAVLRAKQYEGVLGMGYVDELDALRTRIQELGKEPPGTIVLETTNPIEPHFGVTKNEG